MRARVAIALGSNLGDRRAHIEYAIEALSLDLTEVTQSPIVETLPEGVGGEHGPYLNAAVVGLTSLSARDLLDRLLEIEEERGRRRPYPQAPRTLDLDLILYGDSVIAESDFTIPHPRFREREFVLTPLSQIAPDMRDPVTGRTLLELQSAITSASAKPS
ncbi:MAG: 2-amino-4-hydroxy-6-hydroxymethyldihydropteridine diphosphokinase [Vicinamibacterales bacterium]|nr:2-amino-4-hydroxy-6-hydroxymethyldihydropteridine diphosphokinase [Vicinamibacterales bacterium]